MTPEMRAAVERVVMETERLLDILGTSEFSDAYTRPVTDALAAVRREMAKEEAPS